MAVSPYKAVVLLSPTPSALSVKRKMKRGTSGGVLGCRPTPLVFIDIIYFYYHIPGTI